MVSGLPKMVLVDLVFHYGGKWIREPKLLYERKLVHKGKDCELDVDVENITKMLETVVVIDDVSIDCTSYGSENDSDTSSDNSDYNSEELEVLAQERRRHAAGVRVKTLKGEHNKCNDPCGNYKVSATTIAFYFKEKLQANPKYKIKEMRVDMKTAFNIKAHFEKCKRAKIISYPFQNEP
ncbi:hypothetical protein KY285_007092 [Solanum tuberosum]|nr:hypothetical protein KY289_009295 [Solanum tuberosum]KAH0715991.1 hypothetical protein KY284_008896 [Solanum tuberosum]KAH0745435.1 hypothetical protein KY285_007092 [Solanum tuberosum]